MPRFKRPAVPAPGPDHRITLDVVVTDHSGNPVPGLQQQDFTILDNNKPQTILSFRAVDRPGEAANRPLQAIVLVDTVNTSFERAAYQRIQLEKFLRKDGGKLPLPMSLVILSDTSAGQSVTTSDGNILVDSLSSKQPGLRFIGRSQGFYGGDERLQISTGVLEKLASDEATQPGRKLLIWLGPGWPLLAGPEVMLSAKVQNALFQSIVELSTALRKARVTIYNIDETESIGREFYYKGFLKGVGSANNAKIGDMALQVLAAQSGGRVLNSGNDIAGSIADCLVDAKVFYALSFDSPVADRPNEYHSLQVKIGKRGLTGRTRAGYYAQP
jgi:VWFA-related protein